MNDEVKATAGKNGTATAVGTIVIVCNKGGEKIEKKIDLSKGITEAVIEAIIEEVRRRLGNGITHRDIAKYLGIGYSTWGSWRRDAKNGTPVHRKSLLCKLMKFFNELDHEDNETAPTTTPPISVRKTESEETRKKRSEGQLRRQAELRKAKETATTLKELPSFLFDPNWAKALTSEQRLAIARTLLLGTDLAEHERLCKGVIAAK